MSRALRLKNKPFIAITALCVAPPLFALTACKQEPVTWQALIKAPTATLERLGASPSCAQADDSPTADPKAYEAKHLCRFSATSQAQPAGYSIEQAMTDEQGKIVSLLMSAAHPDADLAALGIKTQAQLEPEYALLDVEGQQLEGKRWTPAPGAADQPFKLESWSKPNGPELRQYYRLSFHQDSAYWTRAAAQEAPTGQPPQVSLPRTLSATPAASSAGAVSILVGPMALFVQGQELPFEPEALGQRLKQALGDRLAQPGDRAQLTITREAITSVLAPYLEVISNVGFSQVQLIGATTKVMMAPHPGATLTDAQHATILDLELDPSAQANITTRYIALKIDDRGITLVQVTHPETDDAPSFVPLKSTQADCADQTLCRHGREDLEDAARQAHKALAKSEFNVADDVMDRLMIEYKLDELYTILKQLKGREPELDTLALTVEAALPWELIVKILDLSQASLSVDDPSVCAQALESAALGQAKRCTGSSAPLFTRIVWAPKLKLSPPAPSPAPEETP